MVNPVDLKEKYFHQGTQKNYINLKSIPATQFFQVPHAKRQQARKGVIILAGAIDPENRTRCGMLLGKNVSNPK
jgi:hypothetical protein